MKVLALAIVALSLCACQTTKLSDITNHLQRRECKTQGSITVGGLVPASGWATWDCGKKED
jgi:hypothetical protein